MPEAYPHSQPESLEDAPPQPVSEPSFHEPHGVFDDMLHDNSEQAPDNDLLLTMGDIVQGVVKALSMPGETKEDRLERIQRQLDNDDIPAIPRDILAKNGHIEAKIARRGNHNLELGTTNGAGNNYDRGATLKKGTSHHHHHKNSKKIEKLRTKLVDEEGYQDSQRQNLIDERDRLEYELDQAPRKITNPANSRPLDNEAAHRLKEKVVKLPSHEAYTALLKQALIKDELDPSGLMAVFGPLTPKNMQLATFTATRLVRDGIVDKTGKVIIGKAQIKRLLTPQIEKMSTPEVSGPILNKQLANDLFTKAESAVKKLVSLDASSIPASEKYQEVRTQVWRDMSYMVDEDLRSQLFVSFDQFLKKAKSTYNAAAEIISLRVTEDQSEDTPEEKRDKYRSRTWADVTAIVPEGERQLMLDHFEEFDKEDEKKLIAKQQLSDRPRRQPVQKNKERRSTPDTTPQTPSQKAYKVGLHHLAGDYRKRSENESFTRMSVESFRKGLAVQGIDEGTARKLYIQLQSEGYISQTHIKGEGYRVLKSRDELESRLRELAENDD